jgi:hypothetical protein
MDFEIYCDESSPDQHKGRWLVLAQRPRPL